MKIGASNLLSNHHYSRQEVAEAFVKGDLTHHETPYVMDVVTHDDITQAQRRLPKHQWRADLRIAALESDVAILMRAQRKRRRWW